MRHPTDGTLRRLLDEPAGVADADREHVAGCPVCLSGLAAAREDAAVADAALGVELATDVDTGWRRLSHAVGLEGRRQSTPAAHASRWRAALRNPVVATVGVVTVLAGASVAAAEEATGLAVPQVSELPRGVTGEPTYQVGDQVSAVFTFSTEMAAQATEAVGDTLPPPPPG